MGATVTLIIGPGGCGKTHRLKALANHHKNSCVWVRGSALEKTTDLGALRPLITIEPSTHREAADHIAAALGADTLLVVDDAHQLDEASVATIATLVSMATSRPKLAVAHRPSPRTDLAALAEMLAAHGTIERVGPLDEHDVGAMLAETPSSAIDSEHLTEIFDATGGIPAWAVLLSMSQPGTVLADAALALAGPVDQELTRSGPTTTAVAQTVTLAPELPEDVIAVAAGIAVDDIRPALDELAAGGLLDPTTSELHPAVRAASRSLLTTARRRELHRQLAHAIAARGGEVTDAAEHLLQSGATGPEAAALYNRAGDETRFRDPEAALGWYGEAAIAGESGANGRVGVIEAEAFAGRSAFNRQHPAELTSDTRRRLIAVRGVDEARDARPGRAAELFASVAGSESHGSSMSADTARLLATTLQSASAQVNSATVDEPVDPLDASANMAHRLAVACIAHRQDPGSSGRRFVEAAAALERLEPTFVIPDSPHAIGALHLSSIGDHDGAELLLERAERTNAGAPMLATRHRLLRAWAQIRGGRYELAVATLRQPPELKDTRDSVVFAAVAAGIARRNGDIGRLREAWTVAEPLLLGGTADLFHLEVTGELILAAARLGRLERCDPILATLHDLAAGPQAGIWRVAHAWLHVQLGVECDDGDSTASAADLLDASTAPDRSYDRALAEAARAWTTILTVDDATTAVEQVEQAASALAERNLPWEASRLAGQAAIRVSDASAARRLLEQARQLHRVTDHTEPSSVSTAGLSERELEIGRHVVDGLTHREIGAQLYISPKTVEHHVASIRRKVRAGSRAEMLAILRGLEPNAIGSDGRSSGLTSL